MSRSPATRSVTFVVPILAAAVLLAGCTASTGFAGAGAGVGTRFIDDGTMECSEPGSVTARGDSKTHTAEVTLFAGDCPPPVFEGDGAYCLPTNCFSYTFWWTQAECDALFGEVECIHEGNYGAGHTIVHRVHVAEESAFRFDIVKVLGTDDLQVLYVMEGEITKTGANV